MKNPEGRGLLKGIKHRWDGKITVDRKQKKHMGVEWSHPAYGRYTWQFLMNIVMNFRF